MNRWDWFQFCRYAEDAADRVIELRFPRLGKPDFKAVKTRILRYCSGFGGLLKAKVSFKRKLITLTVVQTA